MFQVLDHLYNTWDLSGTSGRCVSAFDVVCDDVVVAVVDVVAEVVVVETMMSGTVCWGLNTLIKTCWLNWFPISIELKKGINWSQTNEYKTNALWILPEPLIVVKFSGMLNFLFNFFNDFQWQKCEKRRNLQNDC